MQNDTNTKLIRAGVLHSKTNERRVLVWWSKIAFTTPAPCQRPPERNRLPAERGAASVEQTEVVGKLAAPAEWCMAAGRTAHSEQSVQSAALQASCGSVAAEEAAAARPRPVDGSVH